MLRSALYAGSVLASCMAAGRRGRAVAGRCVNSWASGVAASVRAIKRSQTSLRVMCEKCSAALWADYSAARGEDMVEAAGVEPASENVTGQENYMLSRVPASGLHRKRSRRTLRTDKKRQPLV